MHTHILPGIDDGPTRVDDAVAMARLAAADGIRTVACTPHRGYAYDTTPGEVARGIAELQPVIDAEGIDVRLVSGLEIAIDRAAGMDDDELYAATLGGAGRWLLIEMPFQGWPLNLPDLMTGLEVRGHGVVLAHPERAESVQARPHRITELVGRGALVQITAGSLTGDNGSRAERTAHQLLRAGLVHTIASDMHNPVHRPPGIREAWEAAAASLRRPAGDLEWMVSSIPQSVIEGRDVRPPRL
jgi:protein-tyrosine phosphatase